MSEFLLPMSDPGYKAREQESQPEFDELLQGMLGAEAYQLWPDTHREGGYTHPPFYPSTRQEHGKMGKFFKIIRQKSVREPSGIRQAGR